MTLSIYDTKCMKLEAIFYMLNHCKNIDKGFDIRDQKPMCARVIALSHRIETISKYLVWQL